MNLRAYIFLSVAALLLLTAGCQQNPTGPTTSTKASSVSGTVHDAANNPLALARVVDIGSLAQVDTSKTNGSYKLTMELSDNYNTSLYAILAGYVSDTPKVSLKPGDNLTGIAIHMTVQDSSKIIAGNSGPPASIVLKSPTPGTIALKGTGINETAVLTFIVKDSLGNPVVGSNRCIVKFRLSARPDTLTSLNPTSAESNRLTGEVSTTISAGITPGVLQVIASTRGDTVKASPVFLSAGGGLPDSAGVSMGANPINIAGRLYGNLSSTITMFVNDRWGNPVANGTKVSFVTTAGSIVSSTTSQDGLASVTLKSTLNFPTNPLVTLTATTNGDKYYRPSDSSIVRQMHILFSGPTAPIALDTSTTNRFDVPDGGTKFFKFRVSDDLGFPLVAGSTITITVDGADTLTKNIAILGSLYTFPDEQSPSATYFSVGIVDKLFGGGSGSITIGIHVSSTNGSTERWFGGRILPSGAVTGGTFNGPASITAVDTLTKRMYFLETQKPDTLTKLTFIVKDAYGAPMQSTNKALVQFFLSGAPAGVHFYPSMTTLPVLDSTDAKGNVSVLIVSGNTPGTFTVQARTTNGVNVYDASSVPIVVRHGLPDSNFISSEIKKNIFNPKSSVKVGTFTLNLEDYTSDIPAPTNVFFSTTGGAIGALAISDSNSGKAVVNLFGGSEPIDPVLGPGWGNIRATLRVHGGTTLTQSFPFLFSYAPQIAFTDTNSVDTTRNILKLPIGDGQTVNVDFAVWDKNKNPISSANSITVTGTPSGIVLSGDVNLTNLKDTQLPADAIHHISIQNKSSVGPFSVTITVTGESGSVTKTITGMMTTTATIGIGTRVKSLQFVASSISPVYVHNTGLPEWTTLTFALIDSNQQAVTLANADSVLFSILGGTGQEQLSNTTVLSNALGQVSTVFYTGTKSGTFTVLAKVKSIPSIQAIFDITVIGGFPDPNKFTMQWAVTPPDTLLNLPGLVLNGPLATINILALDKYSNPAKPSVIQFDETSGGSVVAVTTDAITGRATASLSGGKPYPNEPSLGGFGFGFVKARTLTESGTFLRDSLPFLFTGAPIITTSKDTVILSDGGSSSITFTVADKYGKMISATPTQLTLTLSISGGIAANSITPETDMPSTGPANQIFPTTYHLKLTDNTPNGGPSGGFTILIVADGASGKTTKTIAGILYPGSSTGNSSYASSIELLAGSPSSSTISVKGTGTTETSTMSFVVKDSSGNPLNITKAATVWFEIIGIPGGGQFPSPTSAITDANGKVTTTINSGTQAGVIQVVAKTIVNFDTIKSAPVSLTIASGLADPAHFTAWVTDVDGLTPRVNLPGIVREGMRIGEVRVQVGDIYGNPVQKGTAVYLTTTGGIVTSSGYTDETGHFPTTVPYVSLYGGPPIPITGFDIVTASTLGQGGVTISKTINFVFSDAPIVTFPLYGSGQLPPIADGSFIDVDYYIRDSKGNPISSGNSVSAKLSGTAASQLTLSLDAALTTSDTKLATDQQYKVRITDLAQGSRTGGDFTLTISVSGPSVPNGGTYTRSLKGYLQAPGVIGSGGTGRAKSILLTSASATDISVKGTGSSETASLVFEARDSLGQAIDLAHSTVLNFTISAPDLGATLTIASAATDGSGRATTLVQSGTKSGVIQVQASTVIDGITVSSLPVRISINSGLPDQTHFTIGAQKFNFPGLDFNGLTDDITIQMGDKYSNPVQPGTVAYFNTSHGIIQTTGSTTSSNGFITKTLYSANPRPEGVYATVPPPAFYGGPITNNGWTEVYSTTAGPNGTTVMDSAKVLWTGTPVIINTGINLFAVPDGGSVGGIAFTVEDRYGHPLSAGTTISLSAEGLKVSSNCPTGGLPDTWNTGPGYTTFIAILSDASPNTIPPVTVATQLVLTVVHPVYGTFNVVLATGTYQ